MKKSIKKDKKISRTIHMVFYWGKFLGINTFALSKKNELKYSYWSFFYCFFLSAIYLYTIYMITIERYNIMLPGETSVGIIVDFFCLIVTTLEILSTWLYLGFHQKRVKNIIKSLVKIEQISAKLNITDDNENLIAQLGMHLIIVNALYIVWITLNNATIMNLQNVPNFLWMMFSIFQTPSYNMGTLFAWIIIVMRRKFRRLNEKVKKLIDNDGGELREMEDEESMEFAENSSRLDSTFLSRQIDTISQLHRELREAIRRIEEHFALVVLLNIMKHFSQISLNVHIIYHYLKGRESITIMNFIYVSSMSTWVIIPVTLLTLVSNFCGSASNEANETGNILQTMLNDRVIFRGSRENAKFNVLFLDLLHNRVKMSLFGFIDVNDFLICSTIATATMYLSIMLQFAG